MTDDGGAPESTRQQILLAAAYEFAPRPYSAVNLDTILARAKVTKGAMYFHFRSKHALALAIIDHQRDMLAAAFADLLAKKLSGLETLIEIGFLIAIEDTGRDAMTAALNLFESLARADGLRTSYLEEWIKHFVTLLEHAVTEGDVIGVADPEALSRLLVSLFMGIRETSDPDMPELYLGDLEKAWALTFPGFGNPDRVQYFMEYIRRRTAIAVDSALARGLPQMSDPSDPVANNEPLANYPTAVEPGSA